MEDTEATIESLRIRGDDRDIWEVEAIIEASGLRIQIEADKYVEHGKIDRSVLLREAIDRSLLALQQVRP